MTALSISVTRDMQGTYTLQHEERFDQAAIYASASPDTLGDLVARTENTQQVIVAGLPVDKRHYFTVEQNGTRVNVAERRLPLEGALNFRDLGGYQTTDGRRVRWGQIYRSDALDRLTENDLHYLANLRIQVICDLRSEQEYTQRRTVLKAQQHVNRPILDELVTGDIIRQRIEASDMDELNIEMMMGSYRRLIDGFGKTFGDVLRSLTEPVNRPALFHCTAGKDRTGLTAAMLLTILGVPRPVIRTDYDLTNIYVQPFLETIKTRVEGAGLVFEPLRAIFGAPPELLDMAFTYLDANYDGVEAYLRQQGGLDDAVFDALRDQLLTD
ncbi:MAG: tyrosine-protein phosphatase [Chloroflexota bacterium]